jgi:hypothetical protein
MHLAIAALTDLDDTEQASHGQSTCRLAHAAAPVPTSVGVGTMLTPHNLAPAGALIAPIDYSILVSVKRVW